MDMMQVLLQAEKALPDLLEDVAGWTGVYIDYHKPFVERLWRPFGTDCRLFLHRIYPCTEKEALLHPHPWPSAIRVLGKGVYTMVVGSAAGVNSPPIVLRTRITATANSRFRYSMEHPDGWHAVIPERDYSLSVMVTGPPWDRTIPDVTASAGPLKRLHEKGLLLQSFAEFFPQPDPDGL